MTVELRRWQAEALVCWTEHAHRGIISVVTGGGKTVFALNCIKKIDSDTTLVVVPTQALLDQWWEEIAEFFGISFDDINVLTGSKSMQSGTINIVVLNTAARLQKRNLALPCFLIIDECHKAASPLFREALSIPSFATLGLSATPNRQYDDGLQEILVPALGSVIYEYTYADAIKDGVIVPFILHNIIFELEEERTIEYERLTRAIAQSIAAHGTEGDKTIALLLKRARVLNMSLNRIRIALRLVAAHKGNRIIIFHEDIRACNLIHRILLENQIPTGVYHSEIGVRQRAEILNAFRQGRCDVLVTCRALDEGFNVPEAQVGIVAASTATRRQRIQRLGRVLRPVSGKTSAIVYTLAATGPEVTRLKEEEEELEGVADVIWSHA